MIDDSALFHAGTYDPQKAHEYYLRTRELKGRKKGLATTTNRAEFKKASTGNEGRYARSQLASRSKTKSRQAELRAQQEALRKRLEHLREVLKKLVEDAKETGHKNASKNAKKDDSKKEPSKSAKKAGSSKAEKDRQPLTAKQKADKARKAKEEYEKEHPNSLSDDVEILREQVKDIKAKIEKALDDARDRRNKAGQKNQKSGSQFEFSSGPTGR